MPLNPGQAPVHIPSDEDRSKGGSVVSPLKILANSVRSRKWCSLNCPFADSCPMLPLSMSTEFEVDVNGVKKHPCKLKDAPPGVQRRIQNMFLNGEEGLLTEIKGAIFVAGTNLGSDVKERLMYADALGRLHKTIYGEKSTLRQPEPLEITVRQLNIRQEGPYSAQEVKIIQQDRAQAILDKRCIPPEDVPEISDPESLFTSPVLDAILAPKPDDIISYDMTNTDYGAT
jgi:hypothetical protein